MKRIITYITGISLLIGSVTFPSKMKETDASTTVDKSVAKYNYTKLLQASLYFYDANMCGGDVCERSAFSWRDDCHTGDEMVDYKGEDGTTTVVDVSGGYHDAGDHAKFGLPQAYSATMLGISRLEFGDSFEDDALKKHYQRIMSHFAEYFEKCTILNQDGSVKAFCYQVGDGNTDHSYWGSAEKQDSVQGTRKSQGYFTSDSEPGTDIVSETAAALAIYAINFDDDKALLYADKLWTYAKNHSKKVATVGCWDFYGSNRYSNDKSGGWADDYALACALLARASEGKSGYDTQKYVSEFNTYKDKCNGWAWVSWDNVGPLALYYGENNSDYISYSYNTMKTDGGRTVLDNVFVNLNDWGSARYNCIMQGLAQILGKVKAADSEANWALEQMNYLLGDNSFNTNFIVGLESNSAKYPHHRSASGYSDVTGHGKDTQAHVLYGALLGGPKKDGTFVDNAEDYYTNEVALDYNSGLVLAAAGAVHYVKEYGDSEVKASQLLKEDASVTGEIRASVVESQAGAPIPNVTPTPTPNVTPTPTPNVTPTPTPNVTPTPTPNVTPTPTPNVTSTSTPNVTPTPTLTVIQESTTDSEDTVTEKVKKKSATSIPDKAYYKNKKLKKVVIGKNITKIGKKAFYGCKNLKTITVKTKKLTLKNVGAKAFHGIYKKVKIKVPKSKKKAYKKIFRKRDVGKKAKIY